MLKCIFFIAGNTARESTRQAVFYLILYSGISLILFSFAFTLFAFGEEIRMIKEMGISTITICCLCVASLSAVNAIYKEIERGTIMTLLSKPVNRKAILVGKFLGILATVSLAFIAMSILLTVSLCIKESLAYRISFLSSLMSEGYSCILQLAFSFLQVAMICAIATAGSVFLPMISNLSCCIFIYIFGNLANFFQGLFQTTEGSFPWYISFLYMFFPNLEGFGTIGMKNNFGSFDLHYIVLLTAYAILYIIFVMTLTLEIFNIKECR